MPGFLNVWVMAHWRAKERIFDGPRPCIIEIKYVLQDEPFIQGFSTWVASELTGLAFSDALIVAHVALYNDFSCFYFCFVHGRHRIVARKFSIGGLCVSAEGLCLCAGGGLTF